MPMPAADLEVEHLSAGYGPTQIVSDISFTVPAGERLAILGRNGVGKTTLLATLMGLTTRHGGRIRVGAEEISGLRTAERALRGLGYVPQTRDVFRSLTVEENLSTGLKTRERKAIAAMYEMFPRLAERRRNLGHELSGGEQQMLSMARTLLGRPSVLLLDEPLEGLAPIVCDQLMQIIADFALIGDMTILLVEQQIERALTFADRVMVIERGRIVWTGSPAALKADRQLVDRLLGVGIH
jgi:branched-chain amino acid transport system ATP-binding protein